MKEIFLSFSPEYYDTLAEGTKKFEYRKRFADDEVMAYIYLTSPVRKVVCKVHLGKKVNVEDLRTVYTDEKTGKRIESYIRDGWIWAMPILEVIFLRPVTLDEIRDAIPDFMPPRSYIYLDGNERLKDFLKLREKVTGWLRIDRSDIESEDICCD